MKAAFLLTAALTAAMFLTPDVPAACGGGAGIRARVHERRMDRHDRRAGRHAARADHRAVRAAMAGSRRVTFAAPAGGCSGGSCQMPAVPGKK